MSDLHVIIESGKTLGLEGEELKSFIKEQQDRLRDERAVEREREREKEEQVRVQLERDRERETMAFELKKLELQSKASYLTPGSSRPRGPKIPPFDEAHDDMDSYIKRFEIFAKAQGIDESEWAIHLSASLKGKALDVYVLLPSEKALDYVALKTALLQRYDMTCESFRRKFRNSKPELGESFTHFITRLCSYFRRWIEMTGIEQTYDSLLDFLVCDQFLFLCNADLKTF